MKRSMIYLGVFALVGAGSVLAMLNKDRFLKTDQAQQSPVAQPSPPASLIAAPGRVEPVSEEIKVGAEISGRLREVPVEEGQRVRRGQVIAAVENGDYRARVASAEAQLARVEAELRRVVNGARGQERGEAWAAVKEAEAVMDSAQSELARRQRLARDGDISREEAERAERQYQVAKAKYEAMSQRHSLVDAGAREEDRARAEAEVALARANLAEARALLDKTFIRSPVTGVVLRKHLKAGELVLASPGAPGTPIITVADNSALRVRVDVDETDVGKLHVGQRAYVTAEAYGDRKFYGRVVRVGEVLGRKNVRTDEPTEKVDTKILETLVELEPGGDLKLGLRVDAFIVCDVCGQTPRE